MAADDPDSKVWFSLRQLHAYVTLSEITVYNILSHMDGFWGESITVAVGFFLQKKKGLGSYGEDFRPEACPVVYTFHNVYFWLNVNREGNVPPELCSSNLLRWSPQKALGNYTRVGTPPYSFTLCIF